MLPLRVPACRPGLVSVREDGQQPREIRGSRRRQLIDKADKPLVGERIPPAAAPGTAETSTGSAEPLPRPVLVAFHPSARSMTESCATWNVGRPNSRGRHTAVLNTGISLHRDCADA